MTTVPKRLPKLVGMKCHETVWNKKDSLRTWFEKFIDFSRASKDGPVLLLLDSHASLAKNIAILDLGLEHRLHILSFLPHCTYRLQPLEVDFKKPLYNRSY